MPTTTLHDVALSSLPIGVECRHCIRHSLLTAEKVRASFGDARTLEEAGVLIVWAEKEHRSWFWHCCRHQVL